MPRLDPRILRLRQTTYESVQRLIDNNSASTEKDALKLIFTKLGDKSIVCGFTLSSFNKFYQQYRDFKRSPYFHSTPLT